MATQAASSRSRETGQHIWRRLAAQFALLAIALQVLVVQPHVEPTAILTYAQAAAASSEAIQPPTAARPDAGGNALACIICQAAVSGRTALIVTATGAFKPQALHLAATLPDAPALSATPSHAWRSRGPPSLI